MRGGREKPGGAGLTRAVGRGTAGAALGRSGGWGVFLLGLDGGGSGARAVLADAQGRILGRASAGPANIVTDPEAARRHVLEAAAAVMAGRCAPAQVCAVLGLAGATLPEAARGFARGLPFGRVAVVGDAEIALFGALGQEADGIVAIVGTGAIFLRRVAGRCVSLGGWGLTLGDEGSGAWIGRRLCATALRLCDGRAAPSPLLEEVLTQHGGAEGLVRWAAAAAPSAFAALVPAVLAAAAAGDAAAEAVLAAAAAEVAAAIAALQPDPALPVVFLGGLGPVMEARLAGCWPMMAARGGPLEGALTMARRLAAAPPSAAS